MVYERYLMLEYLDPQDAEKITPASVNTLLFRAIC